MREKIAMWLAWKLPRRLVYWAFVRMAVSNADGTNYPLNPAEQTTGECLKGHESWCPR